MSSSLREASLQLAHIYEHYIPEEGFAPCNPKQLALVQEELDLSAALMEWYSIASPQNVDIPTIGNYIPLYSGEYLKDALSGYRYDGNTGLVLEDWDASWLIIAGEDQYPAIARTASTNDQTIYLATLSRQNWNLRVLSTSLEGFLLGVAEYIKLFVGHYERNLNISDQDDNINPEFYDLFNKALDENPDTRNYHQNWLQWLGYL